MFHANCLNMVCELGLIVVTIILQFTIIIMSSYNGRHGFPVGKAWSEPFVALKHKSETLEDTHAKLRVIGNADKGIPLPNLVVIYAVESAQWAGEIYT